MKKMFLSVLLMTGIALASQAQKGSVLVYGNLNIGTEKDASDNKYSSFSINPGVGYQFTNNWTAGITGGYGTTKYDPVIGNEQKTNQYAFGIFGRYTHSLGSIFSLYGQADVLYRGRENSAGTKYNGFGVAITPAVQLNVSNGFALNFGFGGINFNTEKMKGANDGSSSFGLNFGEQFNIGISKNFLRKK